MEQLTIGNTSHTQNCNHALDHHWAEPVARKIVVRQRHTKCQTFLHSLNPHAIFDQVRMYDFKFSSNPSLCTYATLCVCVYASRTRKGPPSFCVGLGCRLVPVPSAAGSARAGIHQRNTAQRYNTSDRYIHTNIHGILRWPLRQGILM